MPSILDIVFRGKKMGQTMADMLRIALDGRGSHTQSIKIIDGLDQSMATHASDGDIFTSWELLWHLVFWQDLTIEALMGKKIDWKWAMKNDWPSAEIQAKDSWEDLVKRFKEGVTKMQELVLKVDLKKPLTGWGDASFAQAFMVIAQHNSYHLGQIVMNRKAQGNWPPPQDNG